MLAAMFLNRQPAATAPERTVAAGVGLVTAATVAVVAAFSLGGWDDHRSMKTLVAEYRAVSRGEPLVFFRQVPYSASFYSAGAAELAAEADDLEARLAAGPSFVVLRSRHRSKVPDQLADHLRLVRQLDEYALYESGTTALAARSGPPR
jgi:hypothetical protein